MNPFSLQWLWQAIRGRSLTVALLLLLLAAGVSPPDLVRALLRPLDLSWWAAWVAPVLIFWLSVRLEPVLVPSETLRRRLALGLVVIALAVACVAFLVPRWLDVPAAAG